MVRTLLISDIHGEAQKLDRALANAGYDPAQDELILLGDYIDKGPDSRGTVERVIELCAGGAKALMGNHEQVVHYILTKGTEEQWNDWLVESGGREMLESYGFSDVRYAANVAGRHSRPLFGNADLDRHLAFWTGLDLFIETDAFIFVHAGVDPDVPPAESGSDVLLWIRDRFHSGYQGEKTVVFGHTQTHKLHGDPANHGVFQGENRIIGIDGSAAYGGQLNCLELPSRRVYRD